MNPWNWVAIVVGVVILWWIAGMFIAIDIVQTDNDAHRAQADKEELLRAPNTEFTARPRVRAISQPLPSLHRTHYEP